MAVPEGTRQVTMFVPIDTLERVDEAARGIRGRSNDRTKWVLSAIDEKLERDAALTEGVSGATDQARVKEIVNAYEAMNETGKEWLHLTAVIARNADDFK